MVYRRLPDKLPNPGPFISELRKCREATIRASASVKPFGVTYHALQMITSAIDAATLDDEEPQLLYQEIASERVATLDDALAVIRAGVLRAGNVPR